MDERLRRQVRDLAGDRCEYCKLPRQADALPFQVDHIIAEFHGGPTVIENLAWSCFNCNVYKGTNLAGIDPNSQSIVKLFNPRSEAWTEHFEWQGPILIGKTASGRATVQVLRMNLRDRVEHRRMLQLLGEMTI